MFYKKICYLKNVSTHNLNLKICSYVWGKGSSSLHVPTQCLFNFQQVGSCFECFVCCTVTLAHEDVEENLNLQCFEK